MGKLHELLEGLKAQKAQVEAQDIDAIVAKTLTELEPEIRANAEQQREYEAKVLEIKIEAITDAITVVEAEAEAVVAEQTEPNVEEVALESEEVAE